MKRVLDRIRRDSLAARIEWWAAGDHGGFDLLVAVGTARGERETLQLGRANVLVLHDGRIDQEIALAMRSLTPILQRRAAEERLARTTIQLAQRNEALEDFAALVAHELKSPLQAALLSDDASSLVERALDLVDDLLEAARADAAELDLTSLAAALDRAVENLGPTEVEITAELGATSPFPLAPLHVILRNLLANAVAAGARHIHVAAAQSSRSWRLLIEDDGAGLDDIDAYVAGNGVGLSLCRRMAARFGGALELAPRPSGGTRATLVLQEVPQ